MSRWLWVEIDFRKKSKNILILVARRSLEIELGGGARPNDAKKCRRKITCCVGCRSPAESAGAITFPSMRRYII